jgi:hypothetical protein
MTIGAVATMSDNGTAVSLLVEILLTPGFASAIAVFVVPTVALLEPAVITSRSELPPVVLPGTRRLLPLRAVELLAGTFSFVLDASDLESSGGGLDRGGAISWYDFD